LDTSHPNRINAHKAKKGSGCKMCKPHKGKWAHKFKKKERQRVGTLNLNGMEFEVYENKEIIIAVGRKE
jgi:hypothetical protein